LVNMSGINEVVVVGFKLLDLTLTFPLSTSRDLLSGLFYEGVGVIIPWPTFQLSDNEFSMAGLLTLRRRKAKMIHNYSRSL
jgi:hypothetical protein